jgi:hypothetical protein
MIVTQKHLSRRTVLRGLGATLALPLLDGMVPAFAQIRNSAAKPVRRLAAVYVPNGMNIWKWTPAAEGRNFELGPILESLAPFREKLLVLTGMCNPLADPAEGEAGGDHPRAQASWLTGVHVKRTQGSDIRAGTSMDQIAAAHFSKETQLASLELALEAAELAGGCDGGYSCTYTGTISYKTPTTPLPMEVDPRAVFERLFGASDSTDTKARMARLQTERSILDSVTEETAGLEKKLGAGDRIKLSQYLEAVRDIERRIALAEKQSDRELPVVQKAGGIPSTFEEHAKMMFDLLALAWQTDLTRVSSFLMGRESTGHTYPEIGVPEGAPPDITSCDAPRVARETGQDQRLSREDVRVFPRSSSFNPRRRWQPSGPFDAHLWCRLQQQRPASASQSACPAGRRRRGAAQRWPSHQIRR